MSHKKLEHGLPLVWKDKAHMDPTALSELKRLKITSDSDLIVLYVDDKGISVRIWREGVGDEDMFIPGDEWKRYANEPQMGTPNLSSVPTLTQHAMRRFPDQLT